MGPSYDLLHWYGWKHFFRDWAWRDMWNENVTQRRERWQWRREKPEPWWPS